MVGGELVRRWAVAFVGIPLAVLLIYLGGWVLGGILTLVAMVGAHEFYSLAERGGIRAFALVGIPAAGGLVLLATAFPAFREMAPWAFSLLIGMTLLSLGMAVWLRGVEGAPLPAVSTTISGAIYTGGGMAFAPFLRHLPDTLGIGGEGDPWHGFLLLALPLTATWVGDSCAYFGGRRWGRRRLIPAVSPGKTVEGALAGLLGATGIGVLMAVFLLDGYPVLGLSAGSGAILGLLIGIGAQVGDLAASVLKREAGVKDSGSLLPGHGGVLDRFDAVFFTVPMTYAYFLLLLPSGALS